MMNNRAPRHTLARLAEPELIAPAVAWLPPTSRPGNIDPQVWKRRAHSFMQAYGISRY
jgi:hypothetical protein